MSCWMSVSVFSAVGESCGSEFSLSPFVEEGFFLGSWPKMLT